MRSWRDSYEPSSIRPVAAMARMRWARASFSLTGARDGVAVSLHVTAFCRSRIRDEGLCREPLVHVGHTLARP